MAAELLPTIISTSAPLASFGPVPDTIEEDDGLQTRSANAESGGLHARSSTHGMSAMQQSLSGPPSVLPSPAQGTGRWGETDAALSAATADGLDEGSNLYVSNLSLDVTDNELRDLFAPHGTVVNSRVMVDIHTCKSRGFGFVQYSACTEAAQAIEKLDGSVHRGQTMMVRIASRKTRQPGAQTPKIFLRNVPAMADEAEVRRLCAQYGPIVSCAVRDDKQHGVDDGTGRVTQVAYVTFNGVRAALHATEALNNTRQWPSATHPLLVKVLDSNQKRRSRAESGCADASFLSTCSLATNQSSSVGLPGHHPAGSAIPAAPVGAPLTGVGVGHSLLAAPTTQHTPLLIDHAAQQQVSLPTAAQQQQQQQQPVPGTNPCSLNVSMHEQHVMPQRQQQQQFIGIHQPQASQPSSPAVFTSLLGLPTPPSPWQQQQQQPSPPTQVHSGTLIHSGTSVPQQQQQQQEQLSPPNYFQQNHQLQTVSAGQALQPGTYHVIVPSQQSQQQPPAAGSPVYAAVPVATQQHLQPTTHDFSTFQAALPPSAMATNVLTYRAAPPSSSSTTAAAAPPPPPSYVSTMDGANVAIAQHHGAYRQQQQ